MAETIILDASAWLAVLLKEKNSEHLENLLENYSLLAPELIRYETANGILYAKRSGKTVFNGQTLKALLEIVLVSPIQSVPIEIWWTKSLDLIQRYHITFYDATYLACASTLKLPIITLDKKMANVAREEQLVLV